MNPHEEAIRRSETTAAFPGQQTTIDGYSAWVLPKGALLFRGNEPDKGDRYLWLGELRTASYYAMEDTSLIYGYRTTQDILLVVMNEENMRVLQERFPDAAFHIDHVTGIGLKQQDSFARDNPDEVYFKRRNPSDFFHAENRGLSLQLQKLLPMFRGWIYPYKLHPQVLESLFDELYDPEVMFWRAFTNNLVVMDSARPAIECDE